MAKPKGATSYRLSLEALALLEKLMDLHGLDTRTAVLEMVIRRAARQDLPEHERPSKAQPPAPKRGRPHKS